MNRRDISTLNSLVTLAAETIPGGLSEDEQRVAQIVGAWTIDGLPVRRFCPYCLEVAPVAEESLPHVPGWWLQGHTDNPLHRMWWNMKKRLDIHRYRRR